MTSRHTPDAKVELVAKLRERPSQFECATYKALQAGTANKHQQQSAAAGIVVARAWFAEAANALEQSDAVMEQSVGVPFGPGSRPADRAASAGVSPVPASIPNAESVIARLSNFVDDPAYDIGMVRGVMRDARNLLSDQMARDAAQKQRSQEFEKAGLCWRNPAPNAAPSTMTTGKSVRLTFDAAGNARVASAIEARRAETQGGSVADESAVVATSGETPEPSSIAPVQDDDAESGE